MWKRWPIVVTAMLLIMSIAIPALADDTTPPEITAPVDPIEVTAMYAPGAYVDLSMYVEVYDESPYWVECEDSALAYVGFYGYDFYLGDTVVTCTATDDYGNSASATFTVRVYGDDTPPEITVSESPIVVDADLWDPTGAWIYLESGYVQASDASGMVNVFCTDDVGGGYIGFYGHWFFLGETAVTCTAQDDWGNEAEVSFAVIVQADETPPEITAVEDPLVRGAYEDPGAGFGAFVGLYWNLTVSEYADIACGEYDLYYQFFPVGDHAVTCTAMDLARNVGETTFLVRVVDPAEYFGLEVEILSSTFDPKTGHAFVTVAATAQGDGYITAAGDMRQPFARRFWITGSAWDSWYPYTAGSVHVFDLEFVSEVGLFGGGKAELDLKVSVCTEEMAGFCDWTGEGNFVPVTLRGGHR